MDNAERAYMDPWDSAPYSHQTALMPSRQIRRLRAASDCAVWAYRLAGVSSLPVPESLEGCFTHVIGEETPSEEHHSGVPTIRYTLEEHVANLHRRMPTAPAQLKLGECLERTSVVCERHKESGMGRLVGLDG